MSNVDNALEWADQVADNAPGATHEAILAAEVRRLRAILEPTPDARELASKIRAMQSDDGIVVWPEMVLSIEDAAQLIAAHDARLLDDAADRLFAKCMTSTDWRSMTIDELCAAIKGAK